MSMKINTLYYGDCLEVMKPWPDNSVDLIYLDPPFNSKVKYNVLFGAGTHKRKDDLAQMTAFSDIWEWDADAQARVRAIDNAIGHPAHAAISAFQILYPDGSGMLSYLSYMAERLAELRRLLKASGCVYLHCDPTASHYLKILMDVIFGTKNFRNEVVWSYRRWPAKQKNFQSMHDTILRYANGAVDLVWNQLYEPLAESTLQADGGKKIINVFDETGKRKRGVKTGEMSPGAPLRDVWNIGIISPTAKERLDYPTQKPLALLERIITASSNAGGIVLDPFCGCGTTIDAAHRLRRNWIGIDISSYAIEVVRRERMKDLDIPLMGMPRDLEVARHLAKRKPFEFEKWAITRIPGFAPNTVQRGDSGIDGRGLIHGLEKDKRLCIAQVKGGAPHIDALRAFSGVIQTGAAAFGVFITLAKWDTPAVKKCVAAAGARQVGAVRYNRLVMYSIEEYFRGEQPALSPLAHPRTGLPFQAELQASS